MRIIAGTARRKALETLDGTDITRPTAERVKEGVFSAIQFELDGRRVLDLFCGTGAMGIEALSRGASEVIFVDKDERSVQMTKANLKNLGITAKVNKCDACTFLDKVEGQFDLIVLDPPYKSGLYEKVLEKIYQKNLLADEGIIVCEHATEDTFEYANFEVFDEKRYGNIMLTYLSNKE